MTTYINTGANIALLSGAPIIINYDVALGQDPSTKEWWHPDPGYITIVNGNVSVMASQLISGGNTLTQGNTASQPVLLPNSINGRNGMRFARQTIGVPDRFNYNIFPTGSWTKIVVCRASSGTISPVGGGSMWNGTVPGTGIHLMDLSYNGNDGDILYLRGGAGLELSVKIVRPVDQYFLAMQSYDSVAGQLAGSINGATWVLSGVTGITIDQTGSGIGAIPSAGSGTGFNGDIAMVGLDTTALHLSANLAKLNIWKQLVRDDFGLTIS